MDALVGLELPADDVAIAAIESRPEIIRARELFMVGQDSSGRSEWDAAVRGLEAHEKKQAAILADRWGWHSRAISAAASLGEYDDLSLRYPLPHKPLFERSSSAANISPTWAYGIARSESLFMRDVRSRAGAIGLMQLMPATAERLGAREVCGNNKIAKVSLVGVGMRSHAGIASKMFEALAKEGINILMISTSEIKVSVVVDEKYLELGVRALHDVFELDQEPEGNAGD